MGKRFRWLLIWPTQKIMKPVDGELRVVTVIGGYAGHSLLEEAEEHRKSLEEFWPGLQSHLVSLEQGTELDVDRDPGWKDTAIAEEIARIDGEEVEETEKSRADLVKQKAP